MSSPWERATAWGPALVALGLSACEGNVITPGASGSGGAAAASAADTTTASVTTGTSGGGSGGGAAVPCVVDDDCTDDPAGPFCAASGECVACLDDSHCDYGTLCLAEACVPGCSPTHPCGPGFGCCDQACFDLSSDVAHCGACGVPCPVVPHAGTFCSQGLCTLGSCEPGYADCDQDPDNGCEHDASVDGPCVCVPGTAEPCYTGPAQTLGVGACLSGVHTCDDSGTAWGPCVGEVLPTPEACPDSLDDDCNGVTDDGVVGDLDGDGWTACEGDCVEVADPGHPVPAYVNPGAMEILNNGIDDDCDPTTSELVAPPLCSSGESLTALTGLQLAQAMDLCQTADPLAPLPQKTWGLLGAELRLADGSSPDPVALALFQDVQTAVLTGFGANILPIQGATLAALSTGVMRAPGMAGSAPPAPGTDLNHPGQPPAAFLAAHGGLFPASASCYGACPSGAGAYDGVSLRLSVRVPSNTSSFSYRFLLLSAEYASVCSARNDTYLSLLQSGALGIPADLNVALDGLGNLLSINNLFFEACTPAGCSVCPDGAGSLLGTGFEAGGGTKWLQADVPVVLGENITLDLTVFDVSDGWGDTVVLHDAFRFNEACPPGGCVVTFP